MEQAVIYSPVGPLTLFAEDDFLTALVYGDYGGYDDIPLFREARRQLDEYFDGQRQAFHLPLRPEGTEFQKKVWQVLCRIPYGQMISYRELATRVGAPRAFQAVGQANGHNPLPILIPCHRVIAANGTLGGYSGGLERKRFLLHLEGHDLPAPPAQTESPAGRGALRIRHDSSALAKLSERASPRKRKKLPAASRLAVFFARDGANRGGAGYPIFSSKISTMVFSVPTMPGEAMRPM